jgi:hypothetical protein
MLTNYLLVAIRNIRRNITYSFINVFGLSLQDHQFPQRPEKCCNINKYDSEIAYRISICSGSVYDL